MADTVGNPISPTTSSGRRFTSFYAPLVPNGPLPPGLTDLAAANAYREEGLRPKKVLLSLGIRQFSEGPATRLRRALDQAESRAKRGDSRSEKYRPPFYGALYNYLRNSAPHAQDVYNRLVKPAEYNKDGLTFLDPLRFRSRLEAEKRETPEVSSPIGSNTEYEALAQFALAFALLQAAEAYDLLEPVLLLGRGFEEFFGVTEADQASPLPEAPGVERGVPMADDSGGSIRGTLSGGGKQDVAPTDDKLLIETVESSGPVSIEESGPIAAGTSQVIVQPEVPLQRKGRLGARSAGLARCNAQVEMTRTRRRKLGGTEQFEHDPFEGALKAELLAINDLAQANRSIQRELKEFLNRIATALKEQGIEAEVEHPLAMDEQAAWLDKEQDHVSEITALTEELSRKRAVLAQMEPTEASSPPRSMERLSIHAAVQVLRQRLEFLESRIEAAQDWQATLAALRERLADCVSPKESQALFSLEPETIHTLLRRASIDEAFEPLAPLLFRLLGEIHSWVVNGQPSTGLEMLYEALNHAASSGDVEAYQEVMSYLSPRMLQELLASGHEGIARHVVLVALRASIARRNPFFFVDIWPYEEGWRDRESCLGDRLCRLFTLLQQLYWRTGGLSSVIEALADVGPSPSEAEEAERRLAAARRQAAEDLARRLETTGNMTGHFHRLRQEASNRFFRSFIPSIRARRVREVQVELVQLERKFRAGEMEEETLDAVEDTRGLRADHRTNLRRYIESELRGVSVWLKQEQNLVRGEIERGEDDLREEIRSAIARLPIAADKVHPPAPDTLAGDIKWLERDVGALITAVRRNQFPEAVFAFFGQLPHSGSFFALPGSLETESGAVVHWPSWLEPTPRSKRSWVGHLRGGLTWKDLLQDGIAKIILDRRLSPVQVLESFIQCGELEAAVEAGRFSEFGDPVAVQLVRRAQELTTRRDAVEEHLYRIDRRLRGLSVDGLTHATKQALQQLDAEVYEVLGDLDNLELENAACKTKLVAQRLDKIEEQIRIGESESQQRLEALKAWLSEAGRVLPQNASVEAAERLIGEIREQERPRRAHLVRLHGLDSPGVPDQLRETVRNFLLREDRPSHWPEQERAALADLYIENLAEVSREWWNTLRLLDLEDVTYQKIIEVANLLGERLEIEINAIVSGAADRTPALTLLFEKSRSTIAEYHTELHQLKLIGERVSEDEEGKSIDRERSEAEPMLPWIQAQTRIEGLLAEARYSVGSGLTVQDAYKAFGEGRYADAIRLCGSAWEWARSNKAENEVGPLLGMYAWSRRMARDVAYERAEIDAVGLVLRYEGRICERAKSVEPLRMLEWWINVMEGDGDPVSNASVGGRVASVLTKLAEAAIGATARDRFGSTLRIANASNCAELLWSAVRNLKEETTRARSALLVLLYDLGEAEALEHLFGYASGHRKYLSAFTALATRARSEPSAKLLTAIRQNIRTLQSLKDTWFRDFADKIARRLQPVATHILLDVPEVLERDRRPRHYTLIVSVEPDETDPPLSLSVELLDTSDFVCAEDVFPVMEVVKETLLFERRELEFAVRPRKPEAASNVAFRVIGETASGQVIDETHRFRVQLGGEDRFECLPVTELLEIYAGCDGRPVSGSAFVGREEELTILERSVVRQNPGAVVLFGARRLGKTSLLDELRRRYCATTRKGSQTLFLVIPVDEFSVNDGAKPFVDRFLKHIWNSILNDHKNLKFRQFLEELGVSRQQLQTAGRLEENFEGTSFLMRLREYLRLIRELAAGRITQVVLVLDEFDKLLEGYRKGYEADVEDLTNQLRRAATEEPDIGLVLAGSDLMRRVVGQYRNAFYGSATKIQLDCFDGEKHRESARQIVAPGALRRRQLFSEDVLDDIIKITGGHPLYMRLVACAAASLSRRQRVTRGTVIEAVHGLLCNVVLQGYLPDFPSLVMQPLQALRLMETTDQILAEILLRQFAHHTTLERPRVSWATVVHDDRLLNLRPKETWARIRQELWDANLLDMDDRKQWAFRFPILGERLRIDLDMEFDRLQTEAAAKFGVDT